MSHEPSMEEILSSIKKIIAEDGDKPASVPRVRRPELRGPGAAASDIDVLELTDPVQETEVAPAAPAAAVLTLAAAAEQPVVEPAPPVAQSAAVAPITARPVASLATTRIEKPAEGRPMPASDDMILAEASAAASRNAFAQISKTKAPALPADPGHSAIEAMVADLVRPMLKDWLDANLPRVVEKMVAKEIARLREE